MKNFTNTFVTERTVILRSGISFETQVAAHIIVSRHWLPLGVLSRAESSQLARVKTVLLLQGLDAVELAG